MGCDVDGMAIGSLAGAELRGLRIEVFKRLQILGSRFGQTTSVVFEWIANEMNERPFSIAKLDQAKCEHALALITAQLKAAPERKRREPTAAEKRRYQAAGERDIAMMHANASRGSKKGPPKLRVLKGGKT